jgi:hypothetical protein
MANVSLITKILATKVPKTLFHYTSSVGLVGIIDSKRIWTTKIHYLNDNSELKLAIDYIKQEIDLQKRDIGRTRTNEELDIMSSSLSSIAQVNVAVASFTEKGDQLSQWRGYCEIGKGYSLGFSGSKLRKLVNKAEGYHLVRCVYKEQEHKKIVKELVDSIPVINIRNHPNYGKLPFYAMEFRTAALFIAPIIKAESFSEEKEWRLITPILSFERALFRQGSHSLIPFWEFDLDLENTLQSIIIGPTPEPDLSKRAVSGFLAKGMNSFNNAKRLALISNIIHSKVPYRRI